MTNSPKYGERRISAPVDVNGTETRYIETYKPCDCPNCNETHWIGDFLWPADSMEEARSFLENDPNDQDCNDDNWEGR